MLKLVDFPEFKFVDGDFDSDIFDLKKIEDDFGFLPFYREALKYCRENNIEMLNIGVSHFDWYADVHPNALMSHFQQVYKDYLKPHIPNSYLQEFDIGGGQDD